MIDPSITVALIAATPPTLGLVFVYLQNKKTEREVKAKIQEVHVLINSNLTALLSATKGESFAQGRESGRNEKK